MQLMYFSHLTNEQAVTNYIHFFNKLSLCVMSYKLFRKGLKILSRWGKRSLLMCLQQTFNSSAFLQMLLFANDQ